MGLMLFNGPCDFKGEFQVVRSAPWKTPPRKNCRREKAYVSSQALVYTYIKARRKWLSLKLEGSVVFSEEICQKTGFWSLACFIHVVMSLIRSFKHMNWYTEWIQPFEELYSPVEPKERELVSGECRVSMIQMGQMLDHIGTIYTDVCGNRHMLGLSKWAINFMVGRYNMYEHISAALVQFGSLSFAI
jgi:hypothetical protein